MNKQGFSQHLILKNYIYDHVKKWKIFPDIIRSLQDQSDYGFNVMHIQTCICNDPMYKKKAVDL